jgi:very-short-patch-repair endonuclease
MRITQGAVDEATHAAQELRETMTAADKAA